MGAQPPIYKSMDSKSKYAPRLQKHGLNMENMYSLASKILASSPRRDSWSKLTSSSRVPKQKCYYPFMLLTYMAWLVGSGTRGTWGWLLGIVLGLLQGSIPSFPSKVERHRITEKTYGNYHAIGQVR